MDIVDFISVRECLRMASSSWYSLPRWIEKEYDEGRMIFVSNYISYTVEGVKKWAFPVQYLVIHGDATISVEDEIHFLKIR